MEGVYLNRGLRILIVGCICMALTPDCGAYSVLSHEALVDALWDTKLKPALLSRYPDATPEQLKQAHGYTYGGASIQDLGYYPHGSKQFSDLTHYVRTGDFILALLKESRGLNDFAFALGALSHYVSDLDGHRLATNVGEPILYPRLQRKYGNFITYEDNPAGHLKTEFSFDVLEVAKGNFAPEAYHDFIGFEVAQPLVERAFRDIYGLEMSDLFKDFPCAVESFRRAVGNAIPMATRVAWASKQKEIERAQPGINRKRFIYIMKRSSYERNWGKQYDRPTPGDRTLALIVKLLPPIGPLRDLKLKIPTPAAPLENLAIRTRQEIAAAWQPDVLRGRVGHHQITAGGGWKISSPQNRFNVPSNLNLITADGAPAFVVEFNSPVRTRETVRSFSGYLADHLVTIRSRTKLRYAISFPASRHACMPGLL